MWEHLSELSRVPGKVDLLLDSDPVLRSGLRLSSHGWIDDDPELFDIGTLVLRPEAVSRPIVGALSRRLEADGWHLEHWFLRRLTRQDMRDLWWYTWNTATPDRWGFESLRSLADPHLRLVLRRRHRGACPATIELNKMKGLDFPFVTDSLRALVGAETRALAFLHAPDEPIDLLRELMFERLTPPLAEGSSYRQLGAVVPVRRKTVNFRESRTFILRTMLSGIENLASRIGEPFTTLLTTDAPPEPREWMLAPFLRAVSGPRVSPWPILGVAQMITVLKRPSSDTMVTSDGQREWQG